MSEIERYAEPNLPASAVVMGAINPDATSRQMGNIEVFIRTQMHRGRHYGTIPGVSKPFLWKGGAELLAGLFAYGVRQTRDEAMSYVDRAGEQVEMTYKATVFSRHTGAAIWEADGFASSAEACFRRRACPVCSKPVKRGDQNKGEFACVSCDWKGGEGELSDALANDFGTTMRNVAARAQKRAMVRAIQEACGVSAYFLAPESWEQEEEGKVGAGGGAVCPACGKGNLREKSGEKNGKAYHFWGCDRYPACKHTQNDPPAAAVPPATAQEADASVEAALSIGDEIDGLCEELGITKVSDKAKSLHEFFVANSIVPEPRRQDMTVAQLTAYRDDLKARRESGVTT